MSKQDAIADVVSLIRRNGLTLADISAALNQSPQQQKIEKSGGILTRLFSYVGGILVFAGLCIYVATVWGDLGSAARVIITLGTGFCAFIMAVTATTDERFEKAATPLFLIAAFLQPGGILVALTEYSRGGDPAHGLLFMCLVMTIQQGAALWAKQRTTLAFTTIVFSLSFFSLAFDLMKIDETLIGAVMGLSLTCIGWSLGRSRHAVLAPPAYFLGSALFLAACWDWLENSAGEVLFLGLACGVIFLSTVARSRTLLLVGTLAMLSYIGYFSAEHFARSLGWPLMLILLGLVMIGLGSAAMRINKKYIRGE